MSDEIGSFDSYNVRFTAIKDAHPLMEYQDYSDYTSFAEAHPDRYDKRDWVPNWLWKLVSVRVITVENAAVEMSKAYENMLNSLKESLDNEE